MKLGNDSELLGLHLDHPVRRPARPQRMAHSAMASQSTIDLLTTTFKALTPDVATCLQPDDELAATFADRGSGAWTYGEITLPGCAQLMEAMLDGAAADDCTLLDIGSGVGQIVLYAAAVTRVHRAIGIELVPSRHYVAEAARRTLLDEGHFSSLAHTTQLRCADAFDDAELPSFAEATHIFCANAVFWDELVARLVRRIGEHAPKLKVLATLKEPPADALEAAGLVLVRASNVDVSWLHQFGWPLYLYRRAAEAPAVDAVLVDEGFEAASENSHWFSMV